VKGEIMLNNLSNEVLEEYIKLFEERQSIKYSLGGCPPEEYRVPRYTRCFYCDECWIAALEEAIKRKS
jgi:hypothetical protein